MLTPTVRAASLFFGCAALFYAQTDPGPRQGNPQGRSPLAGGPLQNLNPRESAAWNAAAVTFQDVENVADGLGPRFNLDSCAGCHAYPTPGGASPLVNPQIAAAASHGATNQVPNFLSATGPVRVVRFRNQPNGQPDGGVHDLFTITGRSDAPEGCSIAQPDFSNTNNIVFRIPTLTYGLGLIEAITDSTLRANLAATAARRQSLGIRGTFNTSGNDGTITRFGWKAQNKSLLMFSAEAYNVEEGVTNEIFPTEREENSACATNPLPEDHPDPMTGAPAEIEAFSAFMRFLAPPRPSQQDQSATNGANTFDSIGCALCHTASLQTGNAASPALRNQTVRAYSDFAIHTMGQNLADGITQGGARGGDWRTAPLWGLGDKLFFLHDGRTKDLVQAILQHDGQGSEAHQVIQNYQALSAQDKQDLLNFLRSL
jgi:CxxC motif-containing protein (DUF1111 family)